MGSPFRGLKGIDLPIFLPVGGLHVGSHAAFSESPFDGRVRKSQAIIAGGSFSNLLAAFTLLYNRVAVTPIELTSFFTHEGTFHSFLYACTNHGYHILSLLQKNRNFSLCLMIDKLSRKIIPEVFGGRAIRVDLPPRLTVRRSGDRWLSVS